MKNHGPGDNETEFDNSGEAFEADVDALYDGDEDDSEDDE
jgi:hypothetical protein